MKRTLLFAALLATAGHALAADYKLLNVSYDPTRELYKDVNASFVKEWQGKHPGNTLTIQQSHGGSGKQARSVIDGIPADVVTLALAWDIDEIAERTRALPANWQSRLQHNASPYTSTIVFLVRKGNPKNIRDWGDLVKPGVQVITPNPKTSGGARWNYLAAWGWALKQPGGNAQTATAYLKELFRHVPVLDTGARGATMTFVERGMGDVLLAWENEALMSKKELGPDKFDIVAPSVSILAEPPVAVVDRNVDKKGTRAIATDYLNYLYTPAAQTLIAENYYRPIDKNVAAKYASQFPNVKLFTIQSLGGWAKVAHTHFADGGVFDKISVK